uniref:Retinoblastoma 1 n=1 Tax=Gasterosteus aculeatus aculeatus TaxID=481459 RepID=A0AAQ4R613_GASAC
MPPKKRNSGTTQIKDVKSAESVSPNKKECPELSFKKHRDKDAEFVTLCKSLHVTDLVCEGSWELCKSVQVWVACLFVTATDANVASFTLTQVLKAVNLNVPQFVALVRKLDVNMDTISSKVNSALTRVEKKYGVLLVLYQRFEKERETMRSCWTMFLLAKGRVLQMEDDLVISFQLLLCTLELFIKRCPPDLLQPLYKSAIRKVQSPPTRTSRRSQSKAKSRPLEPEVDLQLLKTLCNENECNGEEVQSFILGGTMGNLSFPPQAKDLNQQYEDHYLKSRDIDGRLFFDGDETVLPSKLEIKSLRVMNANLKCPIKLFLMYFSVFSISCNQNCTVDPTQDVLKRLETVGQDFSQKFGETVGPHCVALGWQRFKLGVRLYYKIMEAMLKSEEKRLSVQNFSKLLNDATFHTSLLACALEVVMATYGGYNHAGAGNPVEKDLCFPWILDVVHLPALDFYKVIESFIKAEPTLSKDIVKHLETCENLIMERIGWRRNSPVFELLKQEHGGGAADQVETPASISQPLQHNHTAADLYLSPVRGGLRDLPPESPATPTSQTLNQPAGQTPRLPKSNSLSLFYKKLYRLAYTRLQLLCSSLLSSHPELEPIIWTLFQHTLQHEYELMRDRHLDQLMMSAMYAICKVKGVDLRFKTIVTAYKDMANTNQETFKHVLIADGHYDSIIVFYNQVFMQKLKTNILQYASTRPPTLSPIPQIPRSPYKFPNSPLRVPGSNNVYISPLKSSRMSPGIMTPRSKMLVSIGESFGLPNRFQKINQMVNSGERSFKRCLDPGSAPKPLKRLRFDVDGQDEADSSTRNRMQEQKMKEDAESKE